MSSGERGKSSSSLRTSVSGEVPTASMSSASSGVKKGKLKGLSRFKPGKNKGDKSFQIGAPTNFEQRSHVSLEFEWSENAEEAFQLHEQLGEGYYSFSANHFNFVFIKKKDIFIFLKYQQVYALQLFPLIYTLLWHVQSVWHGSSGNAQRKRVRGGREDHPQHAERKSTGGDEEGDRHIEEVLT